MPTTPVILFVYNRADNALTTLRHLMANTLAADTDLYVFSDGGKDEKSWKAVKEVRTMLHEVQAEVEQNKSLRSMTIVERPCNYYLERNVVEGIAEVLEKHETVAVLEDDICTSPFFLQYINDALNTYRHDPRVMHISGFTNLDLLADHPDWLQENDETYFTPHMSGWGWATWRDRWNAHFRHFKSREEALDGLTEDDIAEMEYGGVFPCLRHVERSPIPWDICWEIAIHRANGLCLTPAHTMVRNIGLRQGTHFSSSPLLQHFSYDREPLQRQLRITHRLPATDQRTEAAFAEAIKDWGIIYTPLGKVARWIYKRFIKTQAKH
ncbi:MAG: hypothetical protein J5486_00315 [Bacteroidaceae bacterium]|nr:hypothetical protein [Bacteroidaceae bacterium]